MGRGPSVSAMTIRESTTACGRELGRALRGHRERAGIRAWELARRVGWNATRISRVEAGRAPVSEVDVVHYLTHCGVELAEITALLALCRQAGHPGYWLAPHSPWLPDRLRSLIFHESTADQVVGYEAEVLPGLVQTEDYIRALLAAQGRVGEAATPWVRARLQRQVVLRRAARFVFFLHERVLRTRVGDAGVMAGQLLALEGVADRPNVQVRVVPDTGGARSALGGSFLYLKYAEGRPLVFLDAAPGGFFLEEPGFVAPYRELVGDIGRVALGAGESRELLAIMASEVDPVEDAPDDELADQQLQ